MILANMSTTRAELSSSQAQCVYIPNQEKDSPVNLVIRNGSIESINDNAPQDGPPSSARPRLVAPSLCHPHVHLDKAFILSHPRFRHLQVKEGTFQEAMDLTSKAKEAFTPEDLLERGQRLIDESCRAGVTHMRAFVEVDEIVGLKCLEAGAELKKRARRRGLCHVQLCAFAQLPLQPLSESGDKIRQLMREAMKPQYEVEVVGSTPYVEDNRASEVENVRWLVDLALEHDKHLDFHLDYNVDPNTEPVIFGVMKALKTANWTSRTSKCITLGHCTRLIHFDKAQWSKVKSEIGDLPVSFVGLPTSDLYMMKTPQPTMPTELRTTLPVLQMIKDHGINCAIGMNNIGNAFTPQGTCAPLYLANLGIGIYQTGTVKDARLLYECISTRARAAIGLTANGASPDFSLELKQGQAADLVIFVAPPQGFETENRVEDKVYYYSGEPRQTLWSGI